MNRLVSLVLVLSLLCACTGPRVAEISLATPADLEATVSTSTPPPPTSTAAPSATATATTAPTRTPTATPTATATATPSPMPTVDPATLTDMQRGYITLVMLESTAAGIEELARKIVAQGTGTIEDGLIRLVLVTTMGELKEILDEDPPVNALSPAWAEARKAMDEMIPILRDWFDDKIKSPQVIEQVKPVLERLRRATDLAGRQMSREYGITGAQLDSYRDQAVREFRAIVEGTPTPKAG